MKATEFEQVKRWCVHLNILNGTAVPINANKDALIRSDAYCRALHDVNDWILDQQGFDKYGGKRGERPVFPGLDAPYAVLGPVRAKEEFGGGVIQNCATCEHSKWPEHIKTFQERCAVNGNCGSPTEHLPVSFTVVEIEGICGDYGHECPAWKKRFE